MKESSCIHCDLMVAIMDNNNELIQSILKSDIDLNENTACNDALLYAIENNNYELVTLLINHGANPNQFPDIDTLPLIIALESEDINMVNLLLSLGATFENFPLSSFVGAADDSKLFKIVLKSGFDINFTEKKTGRNALHIAAIYGYERMSKFLLDKGIDYNLKDNWNNTAVDLAKVNHHHSIIRIINNF